LRHSSAGFRTYIFFFNGRYTFKKKNYLLRKPALLWRNGRYTLTKTKTVNRCGSRRCCGLRSGSIVA
jgi:hypothetical protein